MALRCLASILVTPMLRHRWRRTTSSCQLVGWPTRGLAQFDCGDDGYDDEACEHMDEQWQERRARLGLVASDEDKQPALEACEQDGAGKLAVEPALGKVGTWVLQEQDYAHGEGEDHGGQTGVELGAACEPIEGGFCGLCRGPDVLSEQAAAVEQGSYPKDHAE